jgi:hypothetical protein
MKNDNLKLLSLVIVVLGIYLGIKGVKVYTESYNKERIDVVKKQVEYKAKKCFDKDDCTGVITIHELREKHYIYGELINPVSNEAINENIRIKLAGTNVIAEWDF